MPHRPDSGPSFSLHQLLLATAAHVRAYIPQKVEAEYVYHDLGHTLQVVDHVRQLGPLAGITQEAQQLLELAAWFHDTGYAQGPEGHELRGCINAKAFLRPRGLNDQQLDQICAAIEATKVPQRPKTVLGQLLCDADLGHLGTKAYWPQCRRVRQELLLTRGVVMSEAQWVDFEIDFLSRHRYFTESGQELFGKRKRKHLKQLRKQKLALAPTKMDGVAALAKRDKKKKKRNKAVDAAMRSEQPEPIGEPTPPPVIEPVAVPITASTPPVVAAASPLLEASIARTDRQASFLLVGCAIALVLVIIGLVPSLSTTTGLLFPGLLLLLTGLATVVMATLAVRLPLKAGEEPQVLRRKNYYLSSAYAILLCGLVAAVLVFSVALIV